MREYTIIIKGMHYTAPRTVTVDVEVMEDQTITSIKVPLECATIEEITNRLQIMLPHVINDPGRALFLKAAKDLTGREMKINVEVEDQNVV